MNVKIMFEFEAPDNDEASSAELADLIREELEAEGMKIIAIEVSVS